MKNIAPLVGEISLPADKSIMHRSVLFSALAEGKSSIRATSFGRDNLATLRIIGQLGVRINAKLSPEMYDLAISERISGVSITDAAESELFIDSPGFSKLSAPSDRLDCGNSGTTARLLCGVLAGSPFQSQLMGDQSLSRRPFRRVTDPLSQMGARFSAENLPLVIEGGTLCGFSYHSPKASAQVKSAILLAGLQADGPVEVIEPYRSRDHTERMLIAMGVKLEEEQLADGRWRVAISEQPARLDPLDVTVPGDFSAAAFFMVAASLIPNSKMKIKGVGFNKTRTGLYDILCRMGAEIAVENRRTSGGEDVVDLLISSSQLSGITISGEDVVRAIDEIPILALAASCALGETRISGAEELRVKESDRLQMTAKLLKKAGVEVEEFPDGLRIVGDPALCGSARDTGDWLYTEDHRLAMCGSILSYLLAGRIEFQEREVVETSFPSFFRCFEDLARV